MIGLITHSLTELNEWMNETGFLSTEIRREYLSCRVQCVLMGGTRRQWRAGAAPSQRSCNSTCINFTRDRSKSFHRHFLFTHHAALASSPEFLPTYLSLSPILSRHFRRATMDSSSRLLLNSTSSLWGDENACSSTLRARLRDDHTLATSSSTKPAPYQDVYQQVQACLGNHLLAPKPDKKIAQTSDTKDTAIQLRG